MAFSDKISDGGFTDRFDRSRFLVLGSQQTEIRNYSRKLYAIRCSLALRSAFLRSASHHVLLLKYTHPGASRHPSKDGIQTENRFEGQLKVSECS